MILNPNPFIFALKEVEVILLLVLVNRLLISTFRGFNKFFVISVSDIFKHLVNPLFLALTEKINTFFIFLILDASDKPPTIFEVVLDLHI